MSTTIASRKPTARKLATQRAATTHWRSFPSKLGWVAIAYSPQALRGVSFGHVSPLEARNSLRGNTLAGDSDDSPPAWVRTLETQLTRLADGKAEDFSGVPLDTSHLTPLGRQILAACSSIRWGNVLSYKQLADLVGRPGAARAVGNVMANNRFPLVVPCHRVVGSAGSLGGYSAPGGLETKRKLLVAEGSQS